MSALTHIAQQLQIQFWKSRIDLREGGKLLLDVLVRPRHQVSPKARLSFEHGCAWAEKLTEVDLLDLFKEIGDLGSNSVWLIDGHQVHGQGERDFLSCF